MLNLYRGFLGTRFSMAPYSYGQGGNFTNIGIGRLFTYNKLNTNRVVFMQDYAKSFYKSKAWQRCRNGYVKQVGGLCEECLKAGRFTPCEIVHHIIPITPHNIYNPEITMSYENLYAVCRKCHAEKHGKFSKRFEIDKLGRVTAM